MLSLKKKNAEVEYVCVYPSIYLHTYVHTYTHTIPDGTGHRLPELVVQGREDLEFEAPLAHEVVGLPHHHLARGGEAGGLVAVLQGEGELTGWTGAHGESGGERRSTTAR